MKQKIIIITITTFMILLNFKLYSNTPQTRLSIGGYTLEEYNYHQGHLLFVQQANGDRVYFAAGRQLFSAREDEEFNKYRAIMWWYYDKNGLLLYTKDAEGNTTEYENGRAMRVKNSFGDVVKEYKYKDGFLSEGIIYSIIPDYDDTGNEVKPIVEKKVFQKEIYSNGKLVKIEAGEAYEKVLEKRMKSLNEAINRIDNLLSQNNLDEATRNSLEERKKILQTEKSFTEQALKGEKSCLVEFYYSPNGTLLFSHDKVSGNKTYYEAGRQTKIVNKEGATVAEFYYHNGVIEYAFIYGEKDKVAETQIYNKRGDLKWVVEGNLFDTTRKLGDGNKINHWVINWPRMFFNGHLSEGIKEYFGYQNQERVRKNLSQQWAQILKAEYVYTYERMTDYNLGYTLGAGYGFKKNNDGSITLTYQRVRMGKPDKNGIVKDETVTEIITHNFGTLLHINNYNTTSDGKGVYLSAKEVYKNGQKLFTLGYDDPTKVNILEHRINVDPIIHGTIKEMTLREYLKNIMKVKDEDLQVVAEKLFQAGVIEGGHDGNRIIIDLDQKVLVVDNGKIDEFDGKGWRKLEGVFLISMRDRKMLEKIFGSNLNGKNVVLSGGKSKIKVDFFVNDKLTKSYGEFIVLRPDIIQNVGRWINL